MGDTILIVDDELLIRTMIKDILIPSGYILKEALNGNDATERLKEFDVSVILLDIMLPGESGIDLLPKIKEKYPLVPIVIITAFPSIDIAILALRAGAFDFLRKPFKPEELIHVVGKAAEHRKITIENISLNEELVKKMEALKGANTSVNEEKTRLKTIINSLSEAVLVFNTAWKLILHNRASMDLIEPTDKEQMNNLVKNIKGLISGSDKRVSTITLEDKSIDVRISKWNANEALYGYIVVMEDVSFREELSLMKKNFMTKVTHELMTPLTSLFTGLSMIASDRLGKKSEEEKRVLEMMQKEVASYRLLLNDLIDFSEISIQTFKINIELFSLTGLISGDIISTLEDDMKVKGIKAEFDIAKELDMIYIDKHYLTKALKHLIVNGIKFGKENGWIKIKAYHDPSFYSISGLKDSFRKSGFEVTGGIVIDVVDNGPGISEEEKKIIFSGFYQGRDIDTSAPEGFGIGIALCIKILSVMGGSLSLTSPKSGGTKFTVRFPCLKPYITKEGL